MYVRVVDAWLVAASQRVYIAVGDQLHHEQLPIGDLFDVFDVLVDNRWIRSETIVDHRQLDLQRCMIFVYVTIHR